MVVALTGLSGSWNPLEHTVCAHQALLANETNRWLADVLINSPYGGHAYGMGSMPYFMGKQFDLGVGTSSTNGTAIAAFTEGVSVDLFSVHNATVWGLAANAPCSAAYAVVFTSVDGYGTTAGSIPLPSNISDIGESDHVAVYNMTGNPTHDLQINNSFTVANEADLSTCFESTQTVPVRSTYLTLGIPFDFGNRTVTVPYVFPISQNFTYQFPANFGTWAIDNLSVPGGPGGGWAFDYLGGCPRG